MRLSQSTNFWFPKSSAHNLVSHKCGILPSLTSFMFKGRVSDFPGGDFIS